MPHIENLLIPAPFYEALSGEFHPACIPGRSMTTLGRIVNAAFFEDQQMYGEPIENGRIGYSYNLSWAKNAEVDMYGAPVFDESGVPSLQLDSLMLNTTGHSQELIVSHVRPDHPVGQFEQQVTIHAYPHLGRDMESRYSVASYQALEVARNAVTNSAEHFFQSI